MPRAGLRSARRGESAASRTRADHAEIELGDTITIAMPICAMAPGPRCARTAGPIVLSIEVTDLAGNSIIAIHPLYDHPGMR